MGGGMQSLQIGDGGLGRGLAVARQAGGVQRVEHRLQALGPFGMADPGPVVDHVGVGEQGDAHGVRLRILDRKQHPLIPAFAGMKGLSPDRRRVQTRP